jgi:hypothetical protein
MHPRRDLSDGRHRFLDQKVKVCLWRVTNRR